MTATMNQRNIERTLQSNKSLAEWNDARVFAELSTREV